MLMLPTAIFLYTFFDILLLKNEAENILSTYFPSRSMIGRRISQLMSVIIYVSLVIPLFLQRFQVQKFCLMNPGEKICKQHAQNCFPDDIPRFFDYEGQTDKYCSVVFPPGFSIHIENFKIDDPGPDNFVLLENFDEITLGYHSKVEWGQRFQKFWKALPDSNQLSKKYIRRENHQCVKSLKVSSFLCSN